MLAKVARLNQADVKRTLRHHGRGSGDVVNDHEQKPDDSVFEEDAGMPCVSSVLNVSTNILMDLDEATEFVSQVGLFSLSPRDSRQPPPFVAHQFTVFSLVEFSEPNEPNFTILQSRPRNAESENTLNNGFPMTSNWFLCVPCSRGHDCLQFNGLSLRFVVKLFQNEAGLPSSLSTSLQLLARFVNGFGK